MWEYLKKVYNQTHLARRFQLECEITNYTQGGLSIQDYFSGFQKLWAEFSDIVCATVSKDSQKDILAVYDVSKRDQFLMKLRSDFENVRSNLMVVILLLHWICVLVNCFVKNSVFSLKPLMNKKS
ncbi:uncharacterized protein LOC109704856 [Ananas comosus]|uniref:Uncharacterized protein LOC109704856 n=1 Tax=Ananas comosus TaxID=4615 RepID=A0A6P5EDC1_ANACO|nr:uncharacterized protein LOC109704856 [Ananas comosus]